VDLLDAEPEPEGVGHVEDAVRPGPPAHGGRSFGILVTMIELLVEAVVAGLHAAQGLLEGLLEVRPMAITSPTDFIWVVSLGWAWGNFSKVKRGILVTT
jgi:hypothetical protein